jgi:hypothetical protein
MYALRIITTIMVVFGACSYVGISHADGTLYGAAHKGGSSGSSTLYTIDKASGTATQVGPIGFNSVGGLDFNKLGTLYGVGRRPADGVEVLITIDPQTGGGSEVGPLVTVPNNTYWDGGLFDLSFRSDEILFLGTLVTPTQCGIATIDVSSGLATVIGFDSAPCRAGNAHGFTPTDMLLQLDDGGGVVGEQSLHVLDQSNGNRLSTTFLNYVNFPAIQKWLRAKSMDLDPVSGTMFVAVKDAEFGFGSDYLGTMSGNTVTYIGPSIEGLAAIAVAPPNLIECLGFEAPMDNYPIKVKKNRALPLKAQLFDAASGYALTDLDLTPPPVVQVWYEHGSSDIEDVSGDALPAGKGDDGNEFVFTDEGKWQFNLKTSNYSASGTYTIFMESGDNTTYVFGPTCETQFVIK